ncbi:class I SAM-dependent methyltransferase [Dethiosulfatarculus sandiegensis]|uniref:UbiE/COQ5 methyltransferase n=1 Tax=Dethiosulfatarculus sandiegensis TaxID=1429043 RepID=A0A0D2HKE7_9BACT|nr:methyltransferase domain-containing protein [Dethiosulfatarculus sandiegensis]KIX11108.1 UbiE/COQ5 methyltransferase [Dethiosulfatarculus sandiegensis]
MGSRKKPDTDLFGAMKKEKRMSTNTNQHKCGESPHRRGRGPSSYWMHDPQLVFQKLKLRPGDLVADLGCGPGDYSLEAAREVQPEGHVFALDRWGDALTALTERARENGIHNLEIMEANIVSMLPLGDGTMDLCLISTVLHIFPWPKFDLNLFPEIVRVLKPGGRLAIIECKKEETNWGPPMNLRISPEEMNRGLKPYGFTQINYTDLGKTYMIIFERPGKAIPG